MWQNTKSMQKSVAFLYTNNENTEREMRESIPFTIAPRTIKMPGTKPNQRGKGSVLKELQNTDERN